jgi:phage shock protein A
MPARRAPAEFSLSFLDVICCGFGAVILLLMITKTVQPKVIEQAMVDAESKVAELTEQRNEIFGETATLNRDLDVKREQISEYEEKIAILQGTLSRTRSDYDALSISQNANAIIQEQLSIARQKRSEEHKE